jgi:biopolymer transport protein ExbD
MRRVLDMESEISTINVTPIIDVALVLVIILMMTAPMMAVPDLGLDLPQANSRGIGDTSHLTVTLALNGQVAIDATVVPREAFLRELSARMADRGEAERLLIVRADEGVAYAAVREILAEARAAGTARVAIATRPRTGSAS